MKMSNCSICAVLLACASMMLLPCAAQSTSSASSTKSPSGPTNSAPVDSNTNKDCSTVENVVAASNNTVFLSAIKAAGLEPYFSDPALVATVFAPNDGAFIAALRTYGISASQLFSNKAALLKIVQNHVVLGAPLDTTQLAALTTPLVTLANQNLSVSDTSGVISVTPQGGGPARIISPNLVACKSIVQVIDYVLLPTLGMNSQSPASSNAQGHLGSPSPSALPGAAKVATAASGPAAAIAPSSLATAPASAVTSVSATTPSPATVPASAIASASASPPAPLPPTGAAAAAASSSAMALACGISGAVLLLLA